VRREVNVRSGIVLAIALLQPVVAAMAQGTNNRPPQSGAPFVVPDLEVTMQWIAAGETQLGSPADEASRGVDEGPVTTVVISHGFWLGRTEITQRQWFALMRTRPSRFVGDDLPVEQVSWDDAMAYAARLTRQERRAGRLPVGYIYTLPSEAEWEYAARGGVGGAFAGSVDEFAWHDQNSGERTHPVATRAANAFGLHDMLGNVWEWCADWYAPYPGGRVIDYRGPSHGFARASRGSSWWAGPRGARPANRYRDAAGNRNDDLGFRIALVKRNPVEQPIVFSGTDRMAPILAEWIALYRRARPEARLQLEAGPPPSAALALAAGTADVGYTGRTLRDSEILAIREARGVWPVSFAVGAGAFDDRIRTHAMAVFVNSQNPLNSISLESLRAVMSEPVAARTWGILGLAPPWRDQPIHPCVAKLGTGATDFVREHAFAGGQWAADVREYAEDEGAIAAAAQDPLALCVAGLPFGDARVRALALSAGTGGRTYAPTREHVASRRYPLGRLLYVHVLPELGRGEIRPEIADFIRIALGEEGQAAVGAAGYLALPPRWRRRSLASLQ
jgi:formylglycine-generating enzyme required for sulfatase activity/ABC-type phosphate transport system substrate-binding protein